MKVPSATLVVSTSATSNSVTASSVTEADSSIADVLSVADSTVTEKERVSQICVIRYQTGELFLFEQE